MGVQHCQVAVVFAWAGKVAVIEPFALACMLQVFFKVSEGQDPMPAWKGRLTHASDRFRKLGEQAVSWRPGQGRGTAPPA